MKEYKVLRLQEGVDPVSETKIEFALNEMAKHGWAFVQMSTGQITYEDQGMCMVPTWVYLIFEHNSVT